MYRFRVPRLLTDGNLVERDFLADPFAREFGVGKLSSFSLGCNPSFIATSPTGGEANSRNSQFVIQLAVQRAGHSLRIFGSSGGFRLPDASVLSTPLCQER